MRSRSQDSGGCTLYETNAKPFPAVSVFTKRRSSVRKSKKDAIGSHLIQAADNVPQKLKFRFLNFPYCIAKFHMSYRSSNSSQWRLHRGILWNTDIPVTRKVRMWSVWWAKWKDFGWTKVMCRYFFRLLSCLYCHCYLGQGNATRRVLLLVGAGENWNLHDSWPRFWYGRQR